MNFIDCSQEVLFSFSLKNPEEIDKDTMDKIKDVLMKVPVLTK